MNNLNKKIIKLSTNKFHSEKQITEENTTGKDENKPIVNKPIGGFPPLFICKNLSSNSTNDQKFATSPELEDINIKNIIEKRKNTDDIFI